VREFVDDPADLFQPPKADRPWQYVVLHHSRSASGSYGEIDRLHREHLGTTGCGYHFVIGNGTLSQDGQIEVTRRWSDQKAGAHCRDAHNPEVNEYGIGICLVGDLDAFPPTPRQVEAAQALVAYLRARYEIPADRSGSHAHLAQNPTACPGKHFPAEAILGTRNLASR
jgi:N-acetyl-anhydromuramyl-L-alanine amidase AmpD